MFQNHPKSIVYYFNIHTKQLFELLRAIRLILINFKIFLRVIFGQFFENSEIFQHHPKSIVYYFNIHTEQLFELLIGIRLVLINFKFSLASFFIDFSKILKCP